MMENDVSYVDKLLKLIFFQISEKPDAGSGNFFYNFIWMKGKTYWHVAISLNFCEILIKIKAKSPTILIILVKIFALSDDFYQV